SNYSYGDAGNNDYVYGYVPEAGDYGSGYAVGVPGGSYSSAYLANGNYVTVTNEGGNAEYLEVGAYTYGYGSAYNSGWNSYGIGEGEGFVYDTSGTIYQFSFGEGYD